MKISAAIRSMIACCRRAVCVVLRHPVDAMPHTEMNCIIVMVVATTRPLHVALKRRKYFIIDFSSSTFETVLYCLSPYK